MGRQKYEFRGPKRKERPRKDWVLLPLAKGAIHWIQFSYIRDFSRETAKTRRPGRREGYARAPRASVRVQDTRALHENVGSATYGHWCVHTCVGRASDALWPSGSPHSCSMSVCAGMLHTHQCCMCDLNANARAPRHDH